MKTKFFPFLFITCLGVNNIFSQDSLKQEIQTEIKQISNKIYQDSDSVIFIDFFGSGDIQKSFNDNSPFNANTSLGILFERHNKKYKYIQSFDLEAILNVASTSDSIIGDIDDDGILLNQRDFGSYILNPISKKQSIFINSNIYFGRFNTNDMDNPIERSFLGKYISGMNFKFIASNNLWGYKEENINLTAVYIRIGAFYEFIPNRHRKEKREGGSRFSYSISGGINYSYRNIFGDIKTSPLLEDILSITQENTLQKGFEFNFNIRLNNLYAEFQLPLLKNNADTPIRGLTNTQALFSVRFIGGFGVALTKETKKVESASFDK